MKSNTINNITNTEKNNTENNIKNNTETGENKFYMSYNNNEKVMSVEEWLASTGR